MYDPATRTFGALAAVAGTSGASGRFTGVADCGAAVVGYARGSGTVEVARLEPGGVAARLSFPGQEVIVGRDDPSNLAGTLVLAVRNGGTLSVWSSECTLNPFQLVLLATWALTSNWGRRCFGLL